MKSPIVLDELVLSRVNGIRMFFGGFKFKQEGGGPLESTLS